MIRFGKKMPYKIFILLNIKNISGSGRIVFFLGHPDPDLEKNGPDPQHWTYNTTLEHPYTNMSIYIFRSVYPSYSLERR